MVREWAQRSSLCFSVVFLASLYQNTAFASRVQTPVGEVANECVRQVPRGSLIMKDGLTVVHPDGTVQKSSVCRESVPPLPQPSISAHASSPPPLNGAPQWVEIGQAHSNRGYTYLNGNWVVPSAPPRGQEGQVIYLWNGLMPSDNSCVIQPVLGWNGFYENGWSIASWICCAGTSTGCYYSAPAHARSGDLITGTMSLKNGNWYITTADKTNGQSTTLAVSNGLAIGDTQGALNWAVYELEAWYVPNCAGYPGSSPIAYFNSTDSQGFGPQESTPFAPIINNYDGCGEDATVYPGQISLYISATGPRSLTPFPAYNRMTTLFTGSSWCLDIFNNGVNNEPIMDTCGNYSGQFWILSPQPGWNGYYQLTTWFTNNDGYTAPKCLDIINDGTDNRLIMDECGNYSGQYWRVSSQPGWNGYFQLTSLFTGPGKCLDIVNNGLDNTLVMNSCGNYSGQFWNISPQPGW